MAKDSSQFTVCSDYSHVGGSLRIIGDVHGCWNELLEMLDKLGCSVSDNCVVRSRDGEDLKLIFVGDLVDRGPASCMVVRFFMKLKELGLLNESQKHIKHKDAVSVYCVLGNHDFRLWRLLKGANPALTHGLDKTIEGLRRACELKRTEWEGIEYDFPYSLEDVSAFLQSLPSSVKFDDSRLLISHAGLSENLQDKDGEKTFHFCLFGDSHGKLDEKGLPVRGHWENEYRGSRCVIYGHTPVKEPYFVNNTLCLDTGCVFGNKLTAVSYPQLEYVSVKAHEIYCFKEDFS